jgi:hypothetical protein
MGKSMKQLLWGMIIALTFLSAACDDDDTVQPGPQGNQKLIKSLFKKTVGTAGGEYSYQWEYDSDNRINKAIYKGKTKHPVLNGYLEYERIYDNYIYDNGLLKSIDVFDAGDSTFGSIRYTYDEDVVTMEIWKDGSDDFEEKYIVNYENQRINSQFFIRPTGEPGEPYYIDKYEFKVMSDNLLIMEELTLYNDTNVYYLKTDPKILNSITLFHLYDSRLLRGGNALFNGGHNYPVALSETMDEHESGNYIATFTPTLDDDNHILKTDVFLLIEGVIKDADVFEYYE